MQLLKVFMNSLLCDVLDPLIPFDVQVIEMPLIAPINTFHYKSSNLKLILGHLLRKHPREYHCGEQIKGRQGPKLTLNVFESLS